MGTGGGTRIPLWISILALAFTQVKGREILCLMFLLIYRIYSLLQDLKLFFYWLCEANEPVTFMQDFLFCYKHFPS